MAVEQTSPPSSLPPQTSRRILRTEACCGRSPGLFLPALTLVTRTGRPRMIEKATAVLRICPPPSPYEPSISSSSIATPVEGSKKNQSVDFPDLLLNIPRGREESREICASASLWEDSSHSTMGILPR